MMEIVSLIVRFERDLESRYYPYLGQACFMGVAHHLLDGCNCKNPVEFTPRGGSLEAKIRMEGILQGDGSAVERFDELVDWTPPPFWCDAHEGWRTARCLQAALDSGGAESAGVEDILGPLNAEVADWLLVMDAACRKNIRFQLEIEGCENPPEDLVRWVERDYEELAIQIREAVEEAGIDITDETGDETDIKV